MRFVGVALRLCQGCSGSVLRQEEAKRLAPSIESVQRLRNEVAEAVGASESALQTLAKYRAEVMALMDKLPVSETDVSVAALPIWAGEKALPCWRSL